MTRYLIFSMVAVVAAALTIWGVSALDDWAQRRGTDPNEPPSNLDSWDWGGER